MKAIHITLILFLAVAAPAAYVIFHPETPQSEPEPVVMREPIEAAAPPALPLAAATAQVVDHREPVQPLEERGDAMLFEMDALQNMPFDQSITMPFD